MGSRVRWILACVLSGGGAAAGLGLALAFPERYGDTHSCPYGASAAACSYPPNLGEQRVTESVAGFVLGLSVFIVLIYLRSERRLGARRSPRA